MIDIYKRNNLLILTYSPQNGVEWIYEDHFDKGEDLTIKRVFHLSQSDVYVDEENYFPEFNDEIQFIIGKLKNDFYVIPARVLNLQNDLLVHKDAQITSKYFGCNLKNNIIKLLEKIANSQIIIGGNCDNSIPVDTFRTLIKQFPTDTEKRHYVNMRIDNILSEYIDATKNYGKIYSQYLEKNIKKQIFQIL